MFVLRVLIEIISLHVFFLKILRALYSYLSINNMTNFKIFSGSSHPQLAKSVAAECGIHLSPSTSKRFSCGEIYTKYDETVRGKEIFIIQTCRTYHTNDDLMEMLFMIDAARQSFASKIHVVIPYFGYSRQDKIHDPREGISAKLIARLIETSGADHIISMHLHSDQTQGFFDHPLDNINPRRLMTEYFKSKNIENPVVVSPDAGGAKIAQKFANDIGAPLAVMHKHRPAHNESAITHVIGKVDGKTPIIVDDMIDTAGSVCAAKQALLDCGCNPDIYLTATHPIFSGPARERLSEANFAEIVCTDTLPVEEPPNNYTALSVAPLLADVIKGIAEQRSISKLHI